jgi:hypothetical protein
MERTRLRKLRIERHASRLAHEAIRHAGTLRAVGAALGKAESTIGHEVTDRHNRAVLDVCVRLINGSATDPLALLQAMEDAYELECIAKASDERLTADGFVLLDVESARDGAEDLAALIGPLEHADALDRYRPIAKRLSLVERELAERGKNLHALYRRRRTA